MAPRMLFVLGAGFAVVGALVACREDDPRYVYTARKYDPAGGCLTEYKSIETVPGQGVSVLCREACLTVDDAVYVSPVCPPLPDNAEALDDGDPECQAALDASRMDASCSAEPAEEDDDDGGNDGVEDAAAGGDPDAGGEADAAEAG